MVNYYTPQRHARMLKKTLKTLKELCHGDFGGFSVKTAQIKTKYLCRTKMLIKREWFSLVLIEHEHEVIKWILEEKINHN